MKIFFFDIETVPTEKSLQENGLLEEQIKLDEPELIKKLSLSAVTAKIHLPVPTLSTHPAMRRSKSSKARKPTSSETSGSLRSTAISLSATIFSTSTCAFSTNAR